MRFVIDAKDTLMNMMYNRVKIVLETTQLQHSNFQVFMKTKDNEIKPLQLCIKILMNKEVLVHLPYRMWRLRLKGKKNVSTKMLHRSIQAQENERKRISRELHDSVIQDMLNIDVELRLLKYKHRDKVLAETSQRIEGLLSQLIDDIRNMSVELRPSFSRRFRH